MFHEYPQSTWYRSEIERFPYALSMSHTTIGAAILDDFRSHARIVETDEDTDLVRYLNTAIHDWENDTRRLLIQATVTEYYDLWPWDWLDVVHLHRAPVSSLTSIKYYDADDNQQTWSSANYVTDLVNEPARIVVAEAATLTSPNIDLRPNCVEIAYVAGQAANVAAIDPATLNAIYVRAASLYGPLRELAFDVDPAAVERCWQAEIRRQQWSL